MKSTVEIYDSTLRDGAQGEGISFSVVDKLNIVKALDELGIPFIEAGNPGSNPKDLEFFEEVKKLELAASQLVAFGSTRRRDIDVEDDSNVQSLLKADTKHVAIFGKSWDFHATDIINTTLEENLNMISDTIRYMVSKGKEVTFDAEHYFDGYKKNPGYAVKTLQAAYAAGAGRLVLCDTNGGCLPLEIYEMTKAASEAVPGALIGIHCHNDSGLAVANSLLAVQAGAKQVQGTFIGFGERCGNANLATLIGDMQLKLDLQCVPDDQLENLRSTAVKVAEIANVTHDDQAPFVGSKAFTHKGGMHIDGVTKNTRSFEHIDPALVGNERRFILSEVAGRSSILKKIQKVAPEMTKTSPETQAIMDNLKELEHDGYQFEGAESTFELIIRKHLGKYKPFFHIETFKTMGEQHSENKPVSAVAMVKVNVNGVQKITAAEGDGPVNALDKAIREALEVFFPVLKKVHLIDYKVRVMDSKDASAAKVRVLITTTDGERDWTTVGVSTDIIEASLIALIDSIEYKLIRDLEKQQ